jgi:hypothetical protein
VKRLLREPLFHFLALGAVLFLIGRGTADETGPMGSRIVVTPGHVQQLAASFAMTWQRPPTEREMQGLIEDYVREEVYYRESLALGLDRDDIIIRRRLRQKMEFLSQDLADAVAPTDDELHAYLEANQDRYRIEPRYTLDQRYFGGSGAGGATRLAAEEALAMTEDPSQPGSAPTGERSMLPSALADVPAREVARVFGERFVEQIENLPVGRWAGPVESGYGQHLVYIRQHVDGRVPTLEEVRPAVARDWEAQRREEVNDQLYDRLLERYTVIVERPDGSEGPAAGTGSPRGPSDPGP